MIKILVKALEAVEVLGKLPFFKYLSIIFFLEKPNLLKDYCNTTLYLLDLNIFGPTYGQFLYAKVPSKIE